LLPCYQLDGSLQLPTCRSSNSDVICKAGGDAYHNLTNVALREVPKVNFLKKAPPDMASKDPEAIRYRHCLLSLAVQCFGNQENTLRANATGITSLRSGPVLYRAFSELRQTLFRFKIQESRPSLQKFRATETIIVPRLSYIVIKLDKLPFNQFILLFLRT
jgi:hypothetical protein